MKPWPILTLFVLGLAGCAAAPDLPDHHTRDEARQEGVAIVSLTLDGKPLTRMESFVYRLREIPPHGTAYATVTRHYDSPRQHARSLWASDQDRPFAREIIVKGPGSREPLDIRAAGQPLGRVATLRLPTGDYEIHGWRLREATAQGAVEITPPHDFSYRFSISSGEVIYLGRLNLRFEERNAQRIAVTDHRAEDLALLGIRYPALTSGKIRTALSN